MLGDCGLLAAPGAPSIRTQGPQMIRTATLSLMFLATLGIFVGAYSFLPI